MCKITFEHVVGVGKLLLILLLLFTFDDDDDVDVNGTSHNVTSLKIRGLELSEWIYFVRVTSIVPLPLLSFVSQLIFSLASTNWRHHLFILFYIDFFESFNIICRLSS